ncbi:tRNA-dihydrouridine synthase [Mammaliicoccus vitulinus]|nr:tRNA-dihydrouridine synthase [Mammaliicoccus vitulinus]QJF24110.1 tRNA-dihydrouridine synthase [Mammaliicoccus vitulinus]
MCKNGKVRKAINQAETRDELVGILEQFVEEIAEKEEVIAI